MGKERMEEGASKYYQIDTFSIFNTEYRNRRRRRRGKQEREDFCFIYSRDNVMRKRTAR